MGDWTGTLPSLLAGDIPSAPEWGEILDALTALTDPWTDWIPTFTNLTVGNGVVVAKYRRLKYTFDWRFSFLLGSTSAVGTGPRFTLPVAPHASYVASRDPMAHAVQLRDGSAGSNQGGEVLLVSGSTVEIFSYTSTGLVSTIAAGSPFIWASTDAMACGGSNEAA